MDSPVHKKMKTMNSANEEHIKVAEHTNESIIVLPFSLRKNVERLANPRPILEVPLEILFKVSRLRLHEDPYTDSLLDPIISGSVGCSSHCEKYQRI